MLSPAARCKPSICTINTILAAQMRQGQFEQARGPYSALPRGQTHQRFVTTIMRSCLEPFEQHHQHHF